MENKTDLSRVDVECDVPTARSTAQTATSDVPSPTSHTAGPWTSERVPAAAYSDPDLGLDEDNLFWVTNAAHAGEVLATVHACSNGSPDANARLMAAAPDLLAALRELNRAWNATQFPCSERMDAALQDADAAIAKAEGTK